MKYNWLTGGTGAATGAASGAMIGTSVLPGLGTAVGAIFGGLMGGLGGITGDTESIKPPDWVIKALREERDLARSDVKRQALVSKKSSAQNMVTRGVYNTTAGNQPVAAIDQALALELSRIDAAYKSSVAGFYQPILREGDSGMGDMAQMAGYLMGKKGGNKAFDWSKGGADAMPSLMMPNDTPTRNPIVSTVNDWGQPFGSTTKWGT